MTRGDSHDRQHIGLSLFKGSNVKVSYIEGNANVTIQNETQRHANEPVISQVIKEGTTITLSSDYNATPFVRTPVGNTLQSTILEFEIIDEQITKPLALFYTGDNQEEFIEYWRQNKGYGVVDGASITIMFGYGEIDNLLQPKHSNMEKDFTKLLTWWDGVIDFYDEAVGLKINPENLWDQNVKTKYYVCGHKGAGGAAYYGVSQFGISNGNTYSILQYNWGNLHEVGHGYQGNLKYGIALGEVSNNMLGWYTQYYAMNTTRFGEIKSFYGGLGNGTLDATEEKVNATRKNWNQYDLLSQLYIMINMIDSFEAEQTWAKINSWYRENKANKVPNYDVFATVISEEYGVNILPYFDAYGIEVSQSVKAKLYEEKLPLVNIAKDVVGEKTSELKANDIIGYDYKLVSNSVFKSLNLSGSLTVNIEIDDTTLLENRTAILYDGTDKVASVKVKDGVAQFTDVPVGTYRLEMPTPAAAYSHSNTYTVVKAEETSITYSYKKLTASETQYDNRMWLGIRGIYETYGIKITNNGDGTATITPGGAKLANSSSGKIAVVSIVNNAGEEIYTTKAENSFYFDKYAEKSSTITIEDGYKIKVYHVTPESRVKVVSTLTGKVVNELIPTENTTVYEFTENGFKLESMTAEEADNIEYNIIKEVVTKTIDEYLSNVTEEELQERNKNLEEKNKILVAILSLREEDRTSEYLKLYNDIVYAGSSEEEV